MGLMLKGFLAGTFLLMLLCAVSADIYMVSPVDSVVVRDAVLELGSAEPGQNVEILLSSKSGYETPWSTASITDVPAGWDAKGSVGGGKTLGVNVGIPETAAQNAYNLTIELSNPEAKLPAERFSARLYVQKGLLRASVVQQPSQLLVGEPIPYHITINNDSIARHRVLLNSTLSEQWFRSGEYLLEPKQAVEKTVYVTPRVYGRVSYSIALTSLVNGSGIAKTDSKLDIMPTLKSKYSAALYGFPFFTATLLPYYAVNSAISYFFP
ncbi:MAG: hypothetical protein V1676_01480 [Candidatus Diapherotrites archaeon]